MLFAIGIVALLALGGMIIGGIINVAVEGTQQAYYTITNSPKTHQAIIESVKPDELEAIKQIALKHNLNQKQITNIAAVLKEIDLDFNRIDNYQDTNIQKGYLNINSSGKPDIEDNYKLVIKYDRDMNVEKITIGEQTSINNDYEIRLYEYKNVFNTVKVLDITPETINKANETFKNHNTINNKQVINIKDLNYKLVNHNNEPSLKIDGQILVKSNVYGDSNEPRWEKSKPVYYKIKYNK